VRRVVATQPSLVSVERAVVVVEDDMDRIAALVRE
jgi:hypothetical protein